MYTFTEITGQEPYQVIDNVTGGVAYFSTLVDAYKYCAVLKFKLQHTYTLKIDTTKGTP